MSAPDHPHPQPHALPPHVQPVALAQAYRLLNHGPTVLVSAAHAGRRNVMAAAWNMPLDFDPPKLAVVIDKATATRKLLAASGWLALGIAGAGLADVVFTVGSVSAEDEAALPGGDKFAAYAHAGLHAWQPPPIPGGPAEEDAPPLVAGCVGWLLAKLLPEPALQEAHDLFLAEGVAAWADARAFADGKYRPLEEVPAHLHTLHHLGAGHFVVPGRSVKARLLARG